MHLSPLTSLRFFAAFIVVLSHLDFLNGCSLPAVKWMAEHVFKEGYIGVTFFFILSGFILSFSYGEKLGSKQVDYLDYIFSRVTRIFPLHILTLMIALPLVIPGVVTNSAPSTSILEVGLNATLMQTFFPNRDLYFSLNAPSWSLSVELFFYALLPFLLTVGTRKLLISQKCRRHLDA